MSKSGYRVLDRLPAGVRVLRPSTLAPHAALIECEHDPEHRHQRVGYAGFICGFCKGNPNGPRVKSIAIVPAGEPAGQEALF